MQKDKTEYWREKLLALQAELIALSDVNKDATNTVELDQSKVGRLSRMDALQGQAMQSALASRRRSDLQQIERALVDLEEGDFGYCNECGDPIPEKRLEINPLVTRCVTCASA